MLPAKETLPTMYYLPSEDHTKPDLPDAFFYLQPELLRPTFQQLDTKIIWLKTEVLRSL